MKFAAPGMNENTRRIELTNRYLRAYARYAGRDKKRRRCIEETLATLMANPYEPRLKTHPLKGSQAGILSCPCGYDCRIIFRLRNEAKTKTEIIILLDVGTHDEIY